MGIQDSPSAPQVQVSGAPPGVEVARTHVPSVRELIVHLALTEDRLRELCSAGDLGDDAGAVAAVRHEQDELIRLLHHQPS